MKDIKKRDFTETSRKAFEISNAIDELNSLLWELYYVQFLEFVTEEEELYQKNEAAKSNDFPF